MFTIDKSKIKPDMIIHTPSLEQMQAVCACIDSKSTPSIRYFKDYGLNTCINTKDLETWSYASVNFYQNECNKTIISFDKILVDIPQQPKQEPSMSKYKVGDTFKNSKGTICTIVSITDFDTYKYKSLGSTYNTTSHNIDKYWTKVTTSTKPTYKVGDKVLVRSDLEQGTDYFMFYSKRQDSATSSMVKLADTIVTITGKTPSGKWLIREHSAWWTDEMFAGLASDASQSSQSVPLYLDREPQAGDYVHRDTRHLTDKVFGTRNSLNTFKVTRVDEYGIYLIKHGSWDLDKFKVINPAHPSHPNYDITITDSILTAVASTPTVSAFSTQVSTATPAKANPKPIPKDKPMAKTLKDNINTQITEVKGAAVNAAELKAGQMINKQAIKLIKPQLPMMVRGFADHPAASVVLANIIGLALKQYAPENPKLAKVSNLMLNAAAFDTIDSFNIDEMVDKLVSGIKLPTGVSLDDE